MGNQPLRPIGTRSPMAPVSRPGGPPAPGNRPPVSAKPGPAKKPPPTAPPTAPRVADRYFELKSEIHRKLIGVLNLDKVSSLPKDRVRAEIGRVVEKLLDDERVPMTAQEENRIVEEVLDEVLGL